MKWTWLWDVTIQHRQITVIAENEIEASKNGRMAFDAWSHEDPYSDLSQDIGTKDITRIERRDNAVWIPA